MFVSMWRFFFLGIRFFSVNDARYRSGLGLDKGVWFFLEWSFWFLDVILDVFGLYRLSSIFVGFWGFYF